MDPTPTALLTANASFYTALSLADFNLMQRLWLEAPEAVCVHPGWPPLHGWAAIRDSWRQIFENQGPLHVWASEVAVRLFGQTAEINCLENIDMSQVRGTGILQTRATNVFRLVAGQWKMLEHHALAMPGGNGSPAPPSAFHRTDHRRTSMAKPQPTFSQLTPHIYKLDLPFFGGRLPVGVFLVRDDAAKGWIMVDAGAPGFEATVLEQVKAQTGGQLPHTLVLTHGHLDHAAAAQKVREAWKIPIAAGRAEIPYLIGPVAYATIPAKSPIYRVIQMSPPALVGRNVQIPLDEGMRLDGLEVFHVPGHAPGMVALLHAGDRALIAADTFYNLGGKLGDPAGPFTYDPALNHASQAKLAALDFDHLFASHGPAIMNTGKQAAQAVVAKHTKKPRAQAAATA